MSALTQKEKAIKKIAIIGGGPSGLFMFKRLLEAKQSSIEIDIFEKTSTLGAGMPYSKVGANEEHVTNVSDNEIPTIHTTIHDWVTTAPKDLLLKFGIDPAKFNEYKVMPRLFFGEYLSGQFNLLLESAKRTNVITKVRFEEQVVNIQHKTEPEEVWIETNKNGILKYDACIICTGHHWPIKNEGKVKGYFDSPYPPSKLSIKLNHTVALRGASLTAIDALRTLARHNGSFTETNTGMLSFEKAEGSENFKLVLHSRNGFLPSLRFHLSDSHLSNHSALTDELIIENMSQNNGFLSLDFVFDVAFKDVFRKKDLDFYNRIKNLTIEEFVKSMMELRETLDPFILFSAEYKEAEKSIRRQESVYWKEMLAVLSFTMNYPAKHLSAEDMQRLQQSLSHLVALVIAFVPQSSAKELLALHAAGALDIIAVGEDSKIETHDEGVTIVYTDDQHIQHSNYFKTFVDCIGQPHLSIDEFPFKKLYEEKKISQARLKFQSAEIAKQKMKEDPHVVEQDTETDYFLKVPGITINDRFQIVDIYGAFNERVYMMAVPYISGYNPDYSGLDFCEAASKIIVDSIIKTNETVV